MMQCMAWAKGLLPGFAPSLGELRIVAGGGLDPEPVAVMAVPIRR